MEITDEKKIESEIDARFIALAIKGDEQAFEKIYERYRLPLYAFLKRRLNQNENLDDLFQQVWIKILANLSKYREQYRFSSWLFRIAQNHLIDYFRSQKGVFFEEIEEFQATTTDNSRDLIILEEMSETLQNALALLPENQRELILLRNQGYSFKEIAEMKGLSINTVLGWRHYAVQKLRNYLKMKEEE